MEKKRVAIAVGSFKTGGAERMAIVIGQKLEEHGYDVHFILQVRKEELPHDFRREQIHYLKPSKSKIRIVRLLKKMIQFRIVSNRVKPDVIVAYSRFSSFLSTFSRGAKVIGVYDFPPYNLSRGKAFEADWVAFRSNVKMVVVPSWGMLKDINNRSPFHKRKMSRIANSTDLALIQNAVAVDPGSDYPVIQKPYIAAMGRFSKQKNFDLLIQSFAKSAVSTTHKLAIAGHGPEGENLRMLVKELGLEDKVVLTGSLQNPFPLIAEAEIFANTSRAESFCLVILEALALGKPVVATDCPHGPSDMIEDGYNGLLVKNESQEEMTAALDRIATDRTLLETLEKNASVSAQKFDNDIIIKDWIELIETV